MNSAELPKTWTLASVRLGEWNLETVRFPSILTSPPPFWWISIFKDVDCDPSGDGSDCADPVQDIPIEKKIPNERYEPAGEQQYNDIALLRLAYPAKLSYFVRPICLPSDPALESNSIVKETFHVAGWGKTETRKNHY